MREDDTKIATNFLARRIASSLWPPVDSVLSNGDERPIPRPVAVGCSRGKLAAYTEADVIAALDCCQNEVAVKLRMAGVIEWLLRGSANAGRLSD